MDVRVLLVDDEPRYMSALAAVVEETPGFTVVGQAGTGEECLRLAATVGVDLVLLDVNLPGIDGLEVARRLRGRHAPPLVVLLSTYDEETGERFLVESGACAYMTKSAFGPDVLSRMWAQLSG